ncbi:hypothetical protein RND71_034160 [Anisodus tanguticus]|uniref:Uncharacterized protein n=1 Tax=Anisodus tanguticus TaxID=243964 RepID=A0AAE1R9M0_9SOLA|nr:hypothetical protein RND71_034160 [Anisodus tanguticus]
MSSIKVVSLPFLLGKHPPMDTIEQQVTEFEAVISMLDKYVSLLESKVQSAYKIPPP